MSFACPRCARAEAPALLRRLVLPPDRRFGEIALEIVACACGFKALGAMRTAWQVSLRDGDTETTGFLLPAAAVDLIDYLIAQCPEPAEEYCDCAAHATLNRRDLRDNWNLLHSFAPFAGFDLPAIEPMAATRALRAEDGAPLDWTAAGDGFTATVDDRTWRLDWSGRPAEIPHELTVGGAFGLELPIVPPFWRGLPP